MFTYPLFSAAGGPAVPPVLESYVYATSGTGPQVPTITVNKPAGVAVDDLLLLIMMNDDDYTVGNENVPPNYNTPSGWTRLLGTDTVVDSIVAGYPSCAVEVFYRIADGSEPASVTPTLVQGTNEFQVGYYLRVSGANTANPINVWAKACDGSNAVNPHVIGGVTTTADQCLPIWAMAHDGSDGLPFSASGTGFSLTHEGFGGAASNGSRLGSCFGVRTPVETAGASGNCTVTGTVNDGGAWFMLAVEPA